MSIMYPTIFSLGIKGLNDEETKIGSSFLVMSIVGGAVAPLLMGLLSVQFGGIQKGYLVPLICFFFVTYYGFYGYRQMKKTL
jgi:MFS transporter, FHS family, L-fucose permease